MKHLLAQGAEAKLFLEDNKILKNRFSKNYRLKDLDDKLRGFRTRREAKILQKLQVISFSAPKLIQNDEKENLVIEKIEGKLVKNILEASDFKKLSEEIGRKIAILHNNSIIHGDLTTSNMIFGKDIYFIDFGLSFFSDKAEDKATDMHLLKQAFESKHFERWKEYYENAVKGYKEHGNDAKRVIERLEKVEARGRYKGKKKAKSI